MGQFIGKGTVSIFELLGAIVLLLWGVRLIRKSAETALLPYAKPSNPIYKNKFYALISGIFGAAFLQSSTALVLIVASVATKITIPLHIGLAFVLGADVGTALAAQLFSFNIKSIGPVLLFAGFIIQHNIKKDQPIQKLGQVFMGFGLILYGLNSIGEISVAIRNSETLSLLLSQTLVNDIALAILISILLTWLSHSSLAIVLMTIELVSSGVIPVDLGLTLIVGANIGACLPAYINSIGQPVEARRLTFGNVIFRLSMGLIALPFLGYFVSLSQKYSLGEVRFLALSHLVYNCAAAVCFIFLTKPIGNFIMKVFPAPPTIVTNKVPTKFLHPNDIENVDLSISNLKKEVLRMSDNIYLMIDQIVRVLFMGENLYPIKKTGKTTDGIYQSIIKYLRKIYQQNLETDQSFITMLINTYCTDLSQINDMILGPICEALEMKEKDKVLLSTKHQETLDFFLMQLKENLNLSQELFRSLDKEQTEQLISRKNYYKSQIIEESLKHKKKLLEGDPDSLAINDFYLELLNNFRRINAHIVSISYPIKENDTIELME